MLHQPPHQNPNETGDYYSDVRDSSEFSARETEVTIAIIENGPSKNTGAEPSIWVWRFMSVLAVFTVAVGLWLLAGPSPSGGEVYKLEDYDDLFAQSRAQSKKEEASVDSDDDDVKEKRRKMVEKWAIEWTEEGGSRKSRRLTRETYKEQLERILQDFKEEYPEKFEALPFDIMEHYKWKVDHNQNFDCMDEELEIYSMLYYDWSKHTEEEPLNKLLNATAISKREDRPDANFSMEHVYVKRGNKHVKVKREQFDGSKVETRTVPKDIINGFKAKDETTKIARRIFRKWEGRSRKGKTDPLCVEECALRLGTLRNAGSYWAVMAKGHTVHRTCPVFERLNYAFLDELLRNDAFRNYLSWKGLRKYSDNGWGTLVYNYVNGAAYESFLGFIGDKYIGGYMTASGDAWYSRSWNVVKAYPFTGKSPHNLPAKPQPHYADSLVLKHKDWPRITF